MNFRQAITTARQAIRANLLPGLLLQAFLVVFLLLYLLHQGTRDFLGHVAAFKQSEGLVFAFVSYSISAALMPEILRIAFFQRGRVSRLNFWNIATGILFWGSDGVLIDLFYRGQIMWFGSGSDILTIACKVFVDQFVFSLFFNTPATVTYFAWRDRFFRPAALRELIQPQRLIQRVFPAQVAAWCIWIPGVCLIYFMPSELQFPVAVLIQVFWVLVLTLINTDRPQEPAPAARP